MTAPMNGNGRYSNGGPAFAPDGRDGSQWSGANPFRLVEHLLPNRAKNTIRAVYAVVGVAAVVLGIVLLIWPGRTLEVFAVALGIYFGISGLVRLVSAIVELGLPGGWRVLDILVGILLIIGGIVMVKNRQLSTAMLLVLVTMTVGIGWLMEGIMALAESWRMPSSGWAVFYAVVSILAGIVMLCAPISSAVWLAVFAGVVMIVVGVLALVRAFRFGRGDR